MKKLICKCGHDKAAHGLWNGTPHCIGYVFDSFCGCKLFAPDNLELLEYLVDKNEIL